ncbi:MAG: tetratricopeptide repeat protein [Candidatus Omnitrophica bacterium]|nr:tetratricopeptide repeat protein [Candidatus Omnitrophota bacterium]
MPNHLILNKIKISNIPKCPVLFILSIAAFLFCSANIYADPSDTPWPVSLLQKKQLSDSQEEARRHRAYGLEQQNIGNIEEAMSSYQKAIELDPGYAVAYNDLGIIYEAIGDAGRAESYYQKALTVDPDYLSSYSNLAMLYESKGDTQKALTYWKERAKLGLPEDPWTQKARSRLVAFKKAHAGMKQPVVDKARERGKEIEELSREVARQKQLKKEQELKKVQEHLGLAKKLYAQGDYKKSLQELKTVLKIDPKEKTALDIKEKIRLKAIEQQKKAKEEKKKRDIENMKARFDSGVKYYQQDNPQAAAEEFSKIGTLITSPQK